MIFQIIIIAVLLTVLMCMQHERKMKFNDDIHDTVKTCRNCHRLVSYKKIVKRDFCVFCFYNDGFDDDEDTEVKVAILMED